MFPGIFFGGYLFITFVICVVRGLMENNRYHSDDTRNHMIERVKGWSLGFISITLTTLFFMNAETIMGFVYSLPLVVEVLVFVVGLCVFVLFVIPTVFFPMIAATDDFSDTLMP